MTMTTIDHLSFPHIVDAIFSYASPSALVPIRLTCRHYRDKLDTAFKSGLVVKSPSRVDTFIEGSPYGFLQVLGCSNTRVRRFIGCGPHRHSDTLIDHVYVSHPNYCWHISAFASNYILYVSTHSSQTNCRPIRLHLTPEVRDVDLVFRPNMDPVDHPRSHFHAFLRLVFYISPVLARGGTVAFVGLEGLHPSCFDAAQIFGCLQPMERMAALQSDIQRVVRQWFHALLSTKGAVDFVEKEEADELREVFCPEEGWKRPRDALKGLKFATLKEWETHWNKSWGKQVRD